MAKKKAKAKSKKKVKAGKALAAMRKPRDSIAQYIKDAFAAGRTDVDKILEGARSEFPGKKPTRGYVNWIKAHGTPKKSKKAAEAPAAA